MPFRSSMQLNLCASWAAHGVTLLVGFFLMPYVLHTLGKGNYGTWIFISSVTSYTGLMYLGFGQAIRKFVATYHAKQDWERLNQTVNVTLAVYLGMGCVALMTAGLLCWLAPHLHDWEARRLMEIRLVILVLGLNVACGMIGSVFGGVLLGIQRFDLERSIAIGSDMLRICLTLALLRFEWGLLTLAGIFLTVTVTENLMYVLLAFRNVKTLSLRTRYLKLAVLRESLGFSIFAFLGNVASQLINATDTIVIGLVLGADAIVPYYIAQRLCQFMQRPIEQIGDVCMPKAGELHARCDTAGLRGVAMQAMGIAFLLAAGIFVGTACFGDALINTWVGDDYTESHRILLVLLAAQVIALPLGVLRSILLGSGHARVPAVMYFAEAVANVILSLILIRPFGILGVALGTAIPIVAIELALLLPYGCKLLQIAVPKMARGVLVPQLVPIGALLIYSIEVETHFNISSGWDRLLVVAAGGGVVLGVVWGACFLIQRNFGLRFESEGI